MLKAFVCVTGEPAKEIGSENVASFLTDEKSHVWVDLSENVEEYQRFLAETMNFHPLVVEDLMSHGMLPKVEEYDGGLFMLMQDIVLLDAAGQEDRLRTYDLFMFIGKNFLVTVHRNRIRAVDSYMQDAAAMTRLLSRGIEPFVHGIIRRMVDSFFPMLDRVDAKLDAAEESIFSKPVQEDLQRVFELRKDVMQLRSIAQQQLNVISRISIGEFEAVSPHGLLLARDIYDHLYRFSEKAAGFREEIMGLLDAYLSQVNNRMNDVVRVLTMMATIMLPLSIIVGFYGMNFHTMPGLSHPYGWLFTILGMVGLVSGMIVYFRHKRWI